MAQISNADKQARFRKKEHLNRHAARIALEWHFLPDYFKSKKLEDFKHSLDKAITLPSGWTDKDYQRAEQALDQICIDFLKCSDQLTIDIDAEWKSTSFDLVKLRESDIKIKNARALASHLISALKLSTCNNAAQAAALMEALRFVGRSLASQSEIPCSQATAISLASIGREYDRPEWLAQKIAEIICQQLGNKLARKVVQNLNKLDHNDSV